jgi:hypothetical protein
VTQEVHPASQPPHPTGQRQWVALVALALGALGFVLCVVALGAAMAPFRLPAHWLPLVMFSDNWPLVCLVAGFIGVWPALVGFGLGLAVVLWARHKGKRNRRGAGAIALGAAALALIGLGLLLFVQPPYVAYGLHEPSAAEQAKLDGLAPEAVVRTYFESRDLSTEYWLEDDAGREFWHANNGSDWSLLAGVDRLRITPVDDKWHPSDATHRNYGVSYSSRVVDSIGDPPGRYYVLVEVKHTPGGPWRITSIGPGY